MAASIIIVLVLSFIQYYLIRNTFELTKEKYHGEVKRKINDIIASPGFNSMLIQEQENLKQIILLSNDKHLDKQQITNKIKEDNPSLRKELDLYLFNNIKKNKDLKNVKYRMEYEEIIVESEGKMDTILTSRNQPLIVFGSIFHTPNTLLLNRNETFSVVNTKYINEKNNRTLKLKLIIRSSNYIDVSEWEKTVFNRMFGTFILGTILILAVIIVFYIVFRTMINQKKIADMKSDFANNITHELKTPLSSVSLILKSMDRADVRQNETLMDELLKSLHRQHGKIQGIVDNVLENAMLNEITVHLEKTEITDFLKLYLADLKLQAHYLHIDLTPNNPLLLTNTLLLEKILNVLIENAQKYSNPETKIHLNTYIDNSSYYIEIQDEGIGIPIEYQSYVFEKFYRIPKQNIHATKGLGLGLYLASQAANRINAKLYIDNKTESGSKFVIQLPL